MGNVGDYAYVNFSVGKFPILICFWVLRGVLDVLVIRACHGAHLLSSKRNADFRICEVRGLIDFVDRWEAVDLDFEVREMGVEGIVGSGMLVYI